MLCNNWIPTGTFWCDSSSSEAWTWILAKNYVMTPLVYIIYNRKKNQQYLQSMLWRRVIRYYRNPSYCHTSCQWGQRSEVAETTLYQWKMKITFPSINAFFCITGKVHSKWKFAVNLPSGHLKCRWLNPWSLVIHKIEVKGFHHFESKKKSRYRKHKMNTPDSWRNTHILWSKTMSILTVHWYHYL